MTDMPEEIFAWPSPFSNQGGEWVAECDDPEEKFIRADVVEAHVAEAVAKEREACAPYLKDGETPAERIERERQDCLALMALLAKEKLRSEAFRNALEVISQLSLHYSAADLGDIAAAAIRGRK